LLRHTVYVGLREDKPADRFGGGVRNGRASKARGCLTLVNMRRNGVRAAIFCLI
jgi:hypothetical protein